MRWDIFEGVLCCRHNCGVLGPSPVNLTHTLRFNSFWKLLVLCMRWGTAMVLSWSWFSLCYVGSRSRNQAWVTSTIAWAICQPHISVSMAICSLHIELTTAAAIAILPCTQAGVALCNFCPISSLEVKSSYCRRKQWTAHCSTPSGYTDASKDIIFEAKRF